MYTTNTSDIAILKRAHQKMVAEVAKVWEGRMENLPYAEPVSYTHLDVYKRQGCSGRGLPAVRTA